MMMLHVEKPIIIVRGVDDVDRPQEPRPPYYTVFDCNMCRVFSTDVESKLKIWLDLNGFEVDYGSKSYGIPEIYDSMCWDYPIYETHDTER